MSNLEIKGKHQLSFLHLAYRVGKKLGKKDKEITKFFLDKPVRTIPSLSDEIAQHIESGKPMLLARLGGTEGVIAGQFCERRLKMRDDYSESMLNWLFTTSGFFADDYENKSEAVDKYARMTVEGMPDCDYLSAMFPSKVYMPYFFKRFARNTTPTFTDFGPYFDIETDKTWIRALKGKKVLVINSFTDSIEYQYKRKDKLVKDKKYELPDFELLVYKTYVTQVGERPGGFRNSFEVLDKMLDDIRKIDFDVALIGAGAYGFPIAVEIKRMGKIAIETCGRTPLFFGIYGERDVKQGIEEHMTDAWIRPMENPPEKFKEVENGCYW